MIKDLNTKHPILLIHGKKLIGRYEMTDGSDVIVLPSMSMNALNE